MCDVIVDYCMVTMVAHMVADMRSPVWLRRHDNCIEIRDLFSLNKEGEFTTNVTSVIKKRNINCLD